MGMYLDVNVIYGVAWGSNAVLAGAYPEAGDELVEDGEPVYGGRLSWGSHGMTLGEPDRYLAVCRPYDGSGQQGRYAERVPCETTDVDDMILWDSWIIDYCTSLGIELDRAPGWLAIASFG